MPLPDLSVQLYSVRQPLATDFAGTLARLAATGLTRVEPYDMLAAADALASALPAAGLTAPTAHQSLTGGLLDEIFSAASDLEVDLVVHPYTPADQWQSREDLERLAGVLAEAAAAAGEHGVRVGYHNHDWELATQLEGRPALEVFAEMLDSSVVLEVDAYWAATAGQHVPALVERLGDRVVAVHLKDGPLDGDTAAQLPLGKGELPAAEILAAAGALQFPVIEFDDYAGDIFDGIEESYRFATTTLGARR
jgi:sugar phosphate isomerase/epimerase